MPSHMQAMTLKDWGKAEAFALSTVPVPTLEADDILIKVAYAGPNPADWKMRAGHLAAAFTPLSAPYVLGLDAAGTVVATGDKVTDFQIGDRVVSGTNLFQSGKPGAYAQYLAVNTKRVAKLPDAMPLKQAASLPTAGITAWQALFGQDKGNLTHGSKKKVLINGASGGVGSFLVQLAKWAGMQVATTCSAMNLDYVKSLGSDFPIDYRQQDIHQALTSWAPEGVDLIIDAVSAGSLTEPLTLLKAGGKLVSIATITDDGDFAAASAQAKAQGFEHILAIVSDSNMAHELEQLVAIINAGEMVFPPIKTYPLTQMTAAHKELETGHVRGKLVVSIEKETI